MPYRSVDLLEGGETAPVAGRPATHFTVRQPPLVGEKRGLVADIGLVERRRLREARVAELADVARIGHGAASSSLPVEARVGSDLVDLKEDGFAAGREPANETHRAALEYARRVVPRRAAVVDPAAVPRKVPVVIGVLARVELRVPLVPSRRHGRLPIALVVAVEELAHVCGDITGSSEPHGQHVSLVAQIAVGAGQYAVVVPVLSGEQPGSRRAAQGCGEEGVLEGGPLAREQPGHRRHVLGANLRQRLVVRHHEDDVRGRGRPAPRGWSAPAAAPPATGSLQGRRPPPEP